MDITPAIKMPIIHFIVTESALRTAKSVLIGLITSSNVDFKSSFKKILSQRYHTVTGLQCEIYECKAEDGVRMI